MKGLRTGSGEHANHIARRYVNLVLILAHMKTGRNAWWRSNWFRLLSLLLLSVLC